MRRGVAPARESFWCTAIAQDVGVGNALTTVTDIVVGSDWTGAIGFAKGATLVRIRGCLSLTVNSLATGVADVYMAIVKLAVGETVPDPTSALIYNEEDILWARNVNMRSLNLTSVGAEFLRPVQFDVDVKAKRKLDTNTTISFVFRATAGSANNFGRVSAVLRGLVQAP